VTVSAGGHWNLAVPGSIADGTYTATVTQGDAAGNTAGSASRTFTLDRTAPSPTVDAPSGDIKVKQPTLSGAAGDAAGDSADLDVALTKDGGAPTTYTVTRTGASWSKPLTSDLADGRYSVTATQTDSAGNSRTSPAHTFRVDTVAPVVTLDAVPDPGKNPTPTFTGSNGGADGTGTPSQDGAVTVAVYSGSDTTGQLVQTVNATKTLNSFSGTAATLADGTYTAVAKQSDAAGNADESDPVTFKVDATGPAVTLTTPVDGLRTNDTTPQFAGAAGDASADATHSADGTEIKVKVYANAQLTGTPLEYTTNRSGATWQLDAAPPLAEGTYYAQAEQTDGAGNRQLSLVRSFTIDTTPPNLAVTDPADGASVKTARPIVTGTTGDTTQVTVTFTKGATTVPVTATPSSGTFSAQPPTDLADGTWTISATQTDTAGNPKTTTARTLKIDTVAPLVTFDAPSPRTADTTPTLTGDAGTAAGDGAVKVDLSGPGSATRTLDATVNAGKWTATPGTPLPEGQWQATARQSDEAGNATTTAARTFTVDATGPAVTITAPADGDFTKDTTPDVTGTAGTAAGDAPTVQVTLDGTGPDVTANATVGAGGAWSVTMPDLAEGDYALTARQKDDVDNATTTTARTLHVDLTAPAVTLTAPTDGALVTTATPTLSGAAGNAAGDATQVAVDIYPGTSASGDHQTITTTRTGDAWTVDAPALQAGRYTVVARQSDAAGNETATAARTFRVDPAGPDVTLAAVADSTDTTPAFSGTAGTAAGDRDKVLVKVYDGATTAGGPAGAAEATVGADGKYSVELTSPLNVGTYTAQAEQSDDAGHLGQSAARTFKVTAPVVTTPTATPTSTPTAEPTASPTVTPTVEPPPVDTTGPRITDMRAGSKKAAAAFFKKGVWTEKLTIDETASIQGALLISAKAAKKLSIKGHTVTLDDKDYVQIGSAPKVGTTAGDATMNLKVAKKARRKLAKARKVKLTVVVTAVDSAGNLSSESRSFTVKRPKPKHRHRR
jgi:hypothetical protein